MPPGKKFGGRIKGTPNASTKRLVAILEDADFCPITKLMNVYALAEKEYARSGEIYDAIMDKRADYKLAPQEDSAPKYLAIMERSAADLMPYLYPRRKALELDVGEKTVQSFTELMQSLGDAGKT